MRLSALFTSASIIAVLFAAGPALADDLGDNADLNAAIFVTDEPVGQPIEPAAPTSPSTQVTWDASAAVSSGRVFTIQRFLLTDEPVLELDLTACKDRVCVDLYRVESLAGRPQDEESDLYVWRTDRLGDWDVQSKVGFIDAPSGADVWYGSLSATRSVSESCTIRGRLELMRGGFKDTVISTTGSCTRKLNERFSLTVSGSAGYSDWAGGFGVGGEVSGSANLGGGWYTSLTGTGFANGDANGYVSLKVGNRF